MARIITHPRYGMNLPQTAPERVDPEKAILPPERDEENVVYFPGCAPRGGRNMRGASRGSEGGFGSDNSGVLLGAIAIFAAAIWLSRGKKK